MPNEDFREFIESLNSNKVKYLVVGGYAVAFHGHPRYTKDLDISRIEINVDGLKIMVIDSEDLKKNKKASGRLQDLADLEKLGDE